MKKTLFAPLGLCLIFILSILLLFFLFIMPFRGIAGNTSYDEAKIKCIKIFNKQEKTFINTMNSAIENEATDNLKIKNVQSIQYHKYERSEKVEFSINAQGMLGGQYWGVYYSSDDSPSILTVEDEDGLLVEDSLNGSFYYKESNGNNVYVTEKIKEGWFFYYMDYDGHPDLLPDYIPMEENK